MHALVIDDNIPNGQVLEVLLAQEDWVTTVVSAVHRIFETLDTLGSVDIVFLDLEFPNESGFDLLPRLREHPVTAAVPIVAYSVHLNAIEDARHAGFDGFLGKPLHSRAFSQHLAQIMRGEPVWVA